MTYSAEGIPQETLEQELGFTPRYWIQGYDIRSPATGEPAYVDRQPSFIEARDSAVNMSRVSLVDRVEVFSRREHLRMATYRNGEYVG